MDIIGWILLGLIAGGVASLLVPGRTPLGCIGVIIVGIAGGLLGGFLFEELFGEDEDELSWLGSILVAILGATLILIVLNAVRGRR